MNIRPTIYNSTGHVNVELMLSQPFYATSRWNSNRMAKVIFNETLIISFVTIFTKAMEIRTINNSWSHCAFFGHKWYGAKCVEKSEMEKFYRAVTNRYNEPIHRASWYFDHYSLLVMHRLDHVNAFHAVVWAFYWFLENFWMGILMCRTISLLLI